MTIGEPKTTSCKLSKATVTKGEIVFTVVNKGTTSRFFEINHKKTPPIRAHKTAKLTGHVRKDGPLRVHVFRKGNSERDLAPSRHIAKQTRKAVTLMDTLVAFSVVVAVIIAVMFWLSAR